MRNILQKKIRQVIPKFYILRDILSRKTLFIVYNSLIESVIRYSLCCWGGMYTSSIRGLQVAQNYTLKVILKKDKLSSTSDLYKESNVLNIKCLYALASVIYIHKNSKLPDLEKKYNTRATLNELLSVPKYSKKVCQNFVNYLGPKCYNLLPLSIRKIKKIKKFNKTARIYIVNNIDVFIAILAN